MRNRVIVLSMLAAVIVMLFGFALTASGQSDREVHAAVQVARDDLHLTIYRNNTTLVRDTRTFELQAGLNSVQFVGVAAHLWHETVGFVALTDPGGVYAVEQRFADAEPPFSIGRAVAENLGETISVTVDEPSGERVTYEGVLLSADNTLVLQQNDGVIVTLPLSQVHSYALPQVRDTRRAEPMLTLLVESVEAGEQQLTISYMTNGVGWHTADYNLRLAADDETVNLSGWISITNNAGVTFEDAHVTLAAGDFDRLQFVTVDTGFAAPTGTPLPNTATPETLGAYGGGPEQPSDLLLELARPVTLPSGQTVMPEFLAGAQVDAYNVYVYDASPRVYGYSGFITDPDYGLTGIETLRNYLAFTTGSTGGPGVPLPAGNIRIYQENESGAALLIGQAQLAFTPAGETVQVFLENPPDLSGERVQTDFLAPSASAVQETIEVRLRNDGDQDVTVTVPERMTRSPRWELLGASVPYTQPDVDGVEFEVEVPAGGETAITYTVLYTAPQ